LARPGHLLIIEKPEDHNIRAPILGMGRVVTISRCIAVLVKSATDMHDLPRTAPLEPPFDLVNRL
jgi:hypothetical protein